MSAIVTGTPTPEAVQFFEQAGETVCYLAARWNDEREYEDIEEYRVPLQRIAHQCGVTVGRMLKRPFGCEFSVGDRKFRLAISARGQYSYRRLS